MASRLDSVPVPPPVEQHLDEIDPGLHRQDVTGFQGPGAPQHGVRLGGRGPAAVRAGEVASDVVHLDAQEVAEAMGEEDPAETARDGVFSRQVDDVFVLQDAGQGQMGLVMEFSPGATRRDAFAERLLGALRGGDQGTEAPVGRPPGEGSRDVGRVAADPGSRIDEQALSVPDVRALPLVVEDRALFVQTDDGGVRKVGLEAADRGEEGAMDCPTRCRRFGKRLPPRCVPRPPGGSPR